jgi:filamentous hemagglutinin family protein
MQKLGWSGKVWHFFEVSRTSVLLGCRDAIWQGRKALLLASVVFSPFTGSQCPVLAQSNLVPDNTLGSEASRVIPNFNGTPNEVIEGGAQRGQNLFHSFREFNIGENRGAYFFVSDPNIQNILARVTGSNRSDIFGTLGTRQVIDGNLFRSNANLFVMNPNGIIFGENARLDVGASFYGTTANGIQFGNQGNFSATNPQTPGVLTINPSALFFNQINQNGAIENRGLLRVPNGESLLLAGGEVRLDGGILGALGGRVDLGGLADAGSIGLDFDSQGLKLQFPELGQRANVSLVNNSLIRVSAGGGGDVTINAQNLDILTGSNIFAGIIGDFGSANKQAGDIALNATNSIRLESSSSVRNDVNFNEKGNAGNINITTNSFLMGNNAILTALTSGNGNAGNIQINVRDRVSLDNSSRILSRVGSRAFGQGGNISISTGTLELSNAGQLSSATLGQGNAGDVFVDARDRIIIRDALLDRQLATGIFSTVEENAQGQGGNVSISTGSLEILGIGEIRASTSGKGDAGNIIINARDNITFNRGFVASNVQSTAQGNGGNILISTGSLQLLSGAQIQASTFGKGDAGNVKIEARDNVSFDGSIDRNNGSFIGSYRIGRFSKDSSSGVFTLVGSEAQGKGGNISISTDSLQLSNNAILNASTFGKGDAGSININARDGVSFTSGGTAYSTVQPGARGQGGDIKISTNLLQMNFAEIQASTLGNGNAGSIIIDASDRITLDSANYLYSLVSETGVGDGGDLIISTGILEALDSTGLNFFTTKFDAATSGKGNAGNIIINASDRIKLDGADINSRVSQGGIGQGKDVRIYTGSLELLNGSQIDASALGNGDSGNVEIKATQSITVAGNDSEGYASAIFSTTGDTNIIGTGSGGNINIETPLLTVNAGGVIDARTFNDKRGGDINLKVNRLQLLNGGQVFTTTVRSGSAGTITVDASEAVTVAGTDPNYFSKAEQFGIGRLSSTSEKSSISVFSDGTGASGSIFVTTPRLTLQDNGTINAESSSVDGGNITLSIRDLLLMRRQGTISATAGAEEKGGDGGNININSKFIIAIPKENSDIAANAFEGNGGRVQINTQGIFGTEFRSQETNQSDITASSKFGVSGIVTIESPDNSSIQNNLGKLPQAAIDTNALIADSCIARRNQQQNGSFFITGSGALPLRPGDPSLPSYSTGDVQPIPTESTILPTETRPWQIGDRVIEPTGVYELPNGKLVLGKEC